MRNFYLIVYDVVNNKRRAKIAKRLEAMGERVQYSVFEVYLNEKEVKNLKKTLCQILNAQEDSLRFYFLCASCQKRIEIKGRGDLTQAPHLQII